MESSFPLIDVRQERDFLGGHAAGAVNLPLEELHDRVHELPDRRMPLRVTDSDDSRAAQAADFLRARGHAVTIEGWNPFAAFERGPSKVRLWQPNGFLIESLARIDALPKVSLAKRALDIAAGSGRDAVYLALQGYDVLAIDILPDALQKAVNLAGRSGLHIQTLCKDLARDPSLPQGSFDVITVFRYLQRDLFAGIRRAIAPGGYVVYETFHEQNRATGRRPLNSAHLLRTGELSEAFAGFDILLAGDGVERDGRFFSNLLARRPSPL
jgi:tellurite methyltransferase